VGEADRELQQQAPAGSAAPASPPVAWNWSSALRGACCSLPPATAAFFDIRVGAALAIGVIPAAIVPLAARRAKRWITVVIGFLTGVSLLAGALLAQVAWLAVVGIFVLAVGASLLAARRLHGMIALTLCLPLIAVGFSYPGWSPAGLLSLLIIAGSMYTWLVSLAWPEPPPPAARQPGVPDRGALLRFGLAAGTAGAVCAAIGFIAGLEHVGWAPAAALLVMRPSADMQRLRSIGRVASVVAGALAGIACIEARLSSALFAVAVALAVTAATALATSSWYLTPGFTTFFVFLLLLAGNQGAASGRFWERVGETALGVGVAYLCGAFIPRLAAAATSPRHPPQAN
jgi:hypothetical protein